MKYNKHQNELGSKFIRFLISNDGDLNLDKAPFFFKLKFDLIEYFDKDEEEIFGSILINNIRDIIPDLRYANKFYDAFINNNKRSGMPHSVFNIAEKVSNSDELKDILNKHKHMSSTYHGSSQASKEITNLFLKELNIQPR